MATLDRLERGGFLITFEEMDNFKLQFAAPPETIKDSLLLEKDVTNFFLLPINLVERNNFLNNAEIEFPIYFNYFAKKRKTFILCTKEQQIIMENVLREALIGPQDANFAQDDFESEVNYHYDIKKEMEHFRSFSLKDCVKFLVFGPNNRLELPNKMILHIRDNKVNFHLPGVLEPVRIINRQSGKEVRINYRYINQQNLAPLFKDFNDLPPHFIPPKLGFTCLGNSNGFDPLGTTAGFIFWIGGRGILVDPPANAISKLEEDNISLSNIAGIILTHCHADHDAGILQNIMKGNRIPIYTTKTIWESFKNKYMNLLRMSGFDEKLFNRMCDFRQVLLDRPLSIENTQFQFNYSLHSIPTMNFSLEFEGKKIFYSSDTYFSKYTEKLIESNIISPRRYQQFLDNFQFHDIIIHEAGGESIHSTFDQLEDMVKDTDKEVYVYHCSRQAYDNYKKANPHTRLKFPETNIENTLTILPRTPLSKFDFLCSVKIFQDLSLATVKQLSEKSEFAHYEPGTVIIKEGAQDMDFYIIRDGSVNIHVPGSREPKLYISYDFFGETAGIRNEPRTATVVAGVNGCHCLKVDGFTFLDAIQNTPLFNQLKNLADMRDMGSYDLLNANYFAGFTPSMKVYLQMEMECLKWDLTGLPPLDDKRIIWRKDDPEKCQYGYFLAEGEAILESNFFNPNKIEIKKQFFFLGDIGNLLFDAPSRIEKCRLSTNEIKLFRIPKKALQNYFQAYPILYPRLNFWF